MCTQFSPHLVTRWWEFMVRCTCAVVSVCVASCAPHGTSHDTGQCRASRAAVKWMLNMAPASSQHSQSSCGTAKASSQRMHRPMRTLQEQYMYSLCMLIPIPCHMQCR